MWCFCFLLQTITGAMSTLTPPVQLENPENQHRFDYIQDVASQHDFDYPTVRVIHSFIVESLNNSLIMIRNILIIFLTTKNA